MMKKLIPLICALGLATGAAANPTDGVVDVDILPGWRTDTGTHMAGLRISLAEGWKTYWRAPGDAGIPPSFDWSGSQNITAVQFHWPVPDVFVSNGMRSIGYHVTVVIPLEFGLREAGAPAEITAQVQLGVCDEICVPVTLSFRAELPADGRRSPEIIAALVDRPHTASEGGVGRVSCDITPQDNGFAVTANLTIPERRGEIVVLEVGNENAWVSEAVSTRQGQTLSAEANIVSLNGGGIALNRSDILISVISQGEAVEIRGCPAG